MKIGIDISSIVYGTGVSLYTSNLTRALLVHFPQEEFNLYGGSLRQYKQLVEFSKTLDRRVTRKIYPIPPKIQAAIFNKLHAPIELFTGKIDVFHSWDWYTPATFRASLVTTIHDLSAIKYPQHTHPQITAKHRRALSWISKEAKAIIAVSDTTKQDIIDILKIDQEKIHVIPEALPVERKISTSTKDVHAIKIKYGIKKPYILSVASQEPRKNLKRIMAAHQNLKTDVELVLVGKLGYDTIKSQAGVIQTGYIDDKDLAALYVGAEALVYPSIYEGFGLPILEGFYYHTPVVTANISSMPEVAGEAAILVDPLSVDSIEAGIKRAMKHKTKLIQAGLKRLDAFSWKKIALETMKVYKMAYVTK